MGRRAHPWYRTSRGYWYVKHNGRQVNLDISDPDDLPGALAAFRKLLAQLPAAETQPPGRTVGQAVQDFLSDLKARSDSGRASIGYFRNGRHLLGKFSETFGEVQVSLLRADQVQKWIDTRPWSSSTQNNAAGYVAALLRTEGISLRLRKPPKESRGAETCLSDEEFAAVLLCLEEMEERDAAALVRFLRETGARPGEAVGLDIDSIDWPNKLARIGKHKTRRHTGRDRILHLNSAAMVITEAQRAKWGHGPLFRTAKKRRRFRPNYLGEILVKVSERVGFRVIAYGLGRHGFATNALAAGVPDAIVAELLGHRGTSMLTMHYSHLNTRSRELKAAAELASSSKPASAPASGHGPTPSRLE